MTFVQVSFVFYLFIFICCVRNEKKKQTVNSVNQIFILNICSVVECHDLCISNEQLPETIIFLNTEQSFICKDWSIYAPKNRNFLLFLPASAAMLPVAHLVVCFWFFKHEKQTCLKVRENPETVKSEPGLTVKGKEVLEKRVLAPTCIFIGSAVTDWLFSGSSSSDY